MEPGALWHPLRPPMISGPVLLDHFWGPMWGPISDLLSLEKTGNRWNHKVLTWPVFPANLGMKKPGTTEEPG